MEQVVAKDASRESTKAIAPFATIIGVDTTFVAVSQLLSTSLPDAYVKATCKYFLDYFGFQNAPFGTILLA